MTVSIEVAGSADAAEMAAVHYLSHTTSFAEFASPEWVKSRDPDEYLKQWQAFLTGNDPRERAWKAVDSGRVVGTVKISAMSDVEAQLASMHVHPEWHRRGIGTQLMDAAMEFMRETGFTTAILGVIQANTAARALYERAGWQVDELRPDGIEGVPVAVYRYDLTTTGR